jgi:hypothetical protein
MTRLAVIVTLLAVLAVGAAPVHSQSACTAVAAGETTYFACPAPGSTGIVLQLVHTDGAYVMIYPDGRRSVFVEVTYSPDSIQPPGC